MVSRYNTTVSVTLFGKYLNIQTITNKVLIVVHTRNHNKLHKIDKFFSLKKIERVILNLGKVLSFTLDSLKWEIKRNVI